MGRESIKGLQNPLCNQQGAYILITGITVVALFGFAALGIEVGRWYAIQGEMSKAIDGAAFAGAKNVNNPNITDLHGFVQQVAQANFPPGLLGTDTPTFLVSDDGNGKITVQGATNSINSLSRVVEGSHGTTAIAADGSAKLRNAEIALVLDVSGSMGGSPISDLKDGANSFVQNFTDQESDNRFALLTFATGVQKPFPMDHGYVSPMTSAINGLSAGGGTNAEDALAQALTLPWSDQSGIPANERTKQVVIFFSDGNPSAFRGQFKHEGVTFDGVAALDGGYASVYSYMGYPNPQASYDSSFRINLTGDGKKTGTSCSPQKINNVWYYSVKWYIFQDSTYGLNSFGPTYGMNTEHCAMTNPTPLGDYVNYLVRQMAIDNAQAIKNNGIEIYTIGLGNIDQNFLSALSSGPKFVYYTPDSSELEGIFQQIANILKLVLIS
ncbi:MAG: VWA domain-containing protein [Nitrospiraceae bacterium]|nr:VWA domain-containing protein [Nitrospira sp.]MCB9773087.1 VWA domain-containing protein [Nitrospiraceae bacterium]